MTQFGTSIGHITFPTPSGCATRYATDAGLETLLQMLCLLINLMKIFYVVKGENLIQSILYLIRQLFMQYRRKMEYIHEILTNLTLKKI